MKRLTYISILSLIVIGIAGCGTTDSNTDKDKTNSINGLWKAHWPHQRVHDSEGWGYVDEGIGYYSIDYPTVNGCSESFESEITYYDEASFKLKKIGSNKYIPKKHPDAGIIVKKPYNALLVIGKDSLGQATDTTTYHRYNKSDTDYGKILNDFKDCKKEYTKRQEEYR
jgi:hypothetical protein